MKNLKYDAGYFGPGGMSWWLKNNCETCATKKCVLPNHLESLSKNQVFAIGATLCLGNTCNLPTHCHKFTGNEPIIIDGQPGLFE